MDIQLLNGVPILSGIDVARLEIHPVCRVAGTEREGQWLCCELELSRKFSFCQDIVRAGPGAVIWTDPGAGDFDVVGDALDGGECLDHEGGEGDETARKC